MNGTNKVDHDQDQPDAHDRHHQSDRDLAQNQDLDLRKDHDQDLDQIAKIHVIEADHVTRKDQEASLLARVEAEAELLRKNQEDPDHDPDQDLRSKLTIMMCRCLDICALKQIGVFLSHLRYNFSLIPYS